MSPSRSRFSPWVIAAFCTVLLCGGCCFAPFVSLAYERHRIDSFCGSVVKGEPIGEVSRRARDKGFSVFDAQALGAGSSSEVMVRTDFLLAHLLCTVKHDGKLVESARRSELW